MPEFRACVDTASPNMGNEMKNGGFKVRRIVAKEHGRTYTTFQVVGYLAGERVRKRFTSHELAAGEKNRLDVLAANQAGGFRASSTRLTHEQLADAESAIRRLGVKSLSEAVEWYLANYRPPAVAKVLSEAVPLFIADRKARVEANYLGQLARALKHLQKWFPEAQVHEVSGAAIADKMSAHEWGPKMWNNECSAYRAFFDFCRHDFRRWCTVNPMALIEPRPIARGLPVIETAARLRELFAFLETYTGSPHRPRKPGFLCPYFYLATFAGLRPSVPDGEIWKIGQLDDVSRIIDADVGVIRIPPEIAKTDTVRQVKIRPNLAAWLARYPLKDYPIVVPNMPVQVSTVRKKFAFVDDVLRHTWISAHVAKFKSLGEAALEAGNSEAIIKSHYLNLMSEAETEAFWSIAPAPN